MGFYDDRSIHRGVTARSGNVVVVVAWKRASAGVGQWRVHCAFVASPRARTGEMRAVVYFVVFSGSRDSIV